MFLSDNSPVKQILKGYGSLGDYLLNIYGYVCKQMLGLRPYYKRRNNWKNELERTTKALEQLKKWDLVTHVLRYIFVRKTHKNTQDEWGWIFLFITAGWVYYSRMSGRGYIFCYFYFVIFIIYFFYKIFQVIESWKFVGNA